MEQTKETGFHSSFSKYTRNFVEYSGYWLPNNMTNYGTISEYWGPSNCPTSKSVPN